MFEKTRQFIESRRIKKWRMIRQLHAAMTRPGRRKAKEPYDYYAECDKEYRKIRQKNKMRDEI